jgi:hypothetical protein
MQHASSEQRMLPTRASASVDEIRRLTRKLRAQHGMRRTERHRAHAVGTACIRCRRNTVHHVSCPAQGAPHANKWIGLARGGPIVRTPVLLQRLSGAQWGTDRAISTYCA